MNKVARNYCHLLCMASLAQSSFNQDARERIIWNDGSEVFLTQIERRLGLTTATTATLKSWIAACCDLLTHENHHHITWPWQLTPVEALLALGHRNDALDVLRADPAPASWACDSCTQRKDLHAPHHAIKTGESVGYCGILRGLHADDLCRVYVFGTHE